MRLLLLVTAIAIAWALAGCFGASNIKQCKLACRGNVLHYSDEEVECGCQERPHGKT